MYQPPFSISTKIIHQIAEISALIERNAIRMEQNDKLLLRKINRIKTIQGSLAIEGNTLSENLITDILDGKTVIAPLREIQEVKNAIKVYDIFHTLNPYDVNDLLKAHKIMMESLIDRAGQFRISGVGVFAGEQAIHVAPPADKVPYLINDLFEWLQNANDHLLIKSCVFHYEFEFIHPFIDGNGRLGRLWQSLILSQLHPIFEHLPVENMVFKNQQQYYDAINTSSQATDCGVFIEFMLEEILATLQQNQNKALFDTVNDTVNDTVKLIIDNPKITFDELALRLKKSRRTISRIMKKLQEEGKITRKGSDKNGFWEVIQ